MIKTKSKTWVISNIIPTKKATMLTNSLKSQKTSSDLSNFYINDWKEKREKIGISSLYLVSFDLQRLNKGLIRFKKQSQCNKPSFCFSIRLQNTKN